MPETAELQAVPERFTPGQSGRGVQRRISNLVKQRSALEKQCAQLQRDLKDTVGIMWQLLDRAQLAPADRLLIANGLRAIENEYAEHGGTNGRATGTRRRG